MCTIVSVTIASDREHVVDTLTHVWMLDGRIITGNENIPYCVELLKCSLAEEKKKVSQFFDQSQLSAQPIVSSIVS